MGLIKRVAPILLLVLCALGGMVMLTNGLVDHVEHRGRALAARSLAEAHNFLHDQATNLVAEAASMARTNKLPEAAKGDRSLRWMLDASGTLKEGYGVGFEEANPSLAGMNVVARALAGVASDGIAVLAIGEKDQWWHLAAAPVSVGGSVGGVAVAGRPMEMVAQGLADQMAALSASSSLPVAVALVGGREVLAGKVSGGLKDILKPGKVDGSVKGVGLAQIGPGLSGGALKLVAGDLIVTEGGRLVLATIVETRKAYDAVSQSLKSGFGLLVLGALLGIALLVLQLRRQERASEALIDWLHTWRSSGAGAPVESLQLPPLLERVARNVDLTLAAHRTEAAPTFSAQVELPAHDDDVFGDDGSGDFEQFSASAVFDAARHDTSAGSASLFDGLPDSETSVAELPPIPGAGLPPTAGDGALPEGPGGAGLPPIPGGGALPPVPGADSALPPAPVDLAAKEIEAGTAMGYTEGQQFHDDPTGQFDVPNDLLAQISGGSPAAEEAADPLEPLFEEYLAMRQRLGERTDGLSIEKFRQKIETSRAQIMEKSGATDVRFTVREKNGKASLRAQPILD